MDNFDLRKFLAESKQVQEKVGTPQYGSSGPSADDIFDPRAQDPTYEATDGAMEEIVAEYVQEALAGKDIKEVSSIIEAHVAKHAMEMKMEVIAEVIDAYEGRLSEIKGSRYFKEMADEGKMSNQEGMIKGLHEMAAAVKEEYKSAHMPEEAHVEEKKEDKGEKEGKSLKETLKPESNSVTMDMEDVLKGERLSTEVGDYMNKLEDYKKKHESSSTFFNRFPRFS